MSGRTSHNDYRLAEWAALIDEDVPEEVLDRDASTEFGTGSGRDAERRGGEGDR